MLNRLYRGWILWVTALAAPVSLLVAGHAVPSMGIGALWISWLVQVCGALILGRQLRHTKAIQSELIQHMADWAVAVDADGVVRYISPSVRQYGGDPDIIGRPWESSAMAGHEPFYADLINSVTSGGPLVAGPVNAEVAVPRGDRRIFEAVTYRSDYGRHGCTVCLFRDVTEKLRLQESMVDMDRLAAVAQLATGVAHNFNNVLGGIMLNTGLLLTAEGAGRERLSERIMASAERGALLCRTLLTFARGETRGLAPVPVAPLLADVVSLFGTEAHRHAVSVAWTADPQMVVEADCGRLQHVLLDLLFHARSLTASGCTITVQALHTAENVRISVSHAGLPIAPAQLPFIFQPFFGTGSGKPAELGLRLAVCQRLASDMGGRIEVNSLPGTGTTFTLVLPYRGIIDDIGSSQEASL